MSGEDVDKAAGAIPTTAVEEAALSRPRDGPATKFQADDYIRTLPLALLRLQMPCTVTKTIEHEESSAHNISPLVSFPTFGPQFSLVLVAGWPPSPNLRNGRGLSLKSYNNFMEQVKLCFDSADFFVEAAEEKSSTPGVLVPAVYLYPFQCLHVTVATFHSFTIGTNDEGRRDLLQKQWSLILESASRREEWPKEHSIKLKVDRAQIGSRAGIILYRETTGCLNDMRRSIAEETKKRRDELLAEGIDANTLSIPSIIHSTFMRFGRVPLKSRGEEIQEKFEKNVLSSLEAIFSDEIIIDNVKLVCERTPYMHIPNDDKHVIASYSLGGQ